MPLQPGSLKGGNDLQHYTCGDPRTHVSSWFICFIFSLHGHRWIDASCYFPKNLRVSGISDLCCAHLQYFVVCCDEVFVASCGYFTIWILSGFLCGILQSVVVVCVLQPVHGYGHVFHKLLFPVTMNYFNNSPSAHCFVSVCSYLSKERWSAMILLKGPCS